MTFLSFCTSTGVPSAIFHAMVEHADAIGNAHDDAHGVLDKQNGHGALIAHAAHEGHHLQTLAGIHSGHRFVEHEKAGTGG